MGSGKTDCLEGELIIPGQQWGGRVILFSKSVLQIMVDYCSVTRQIYRITVSSFIQPISPVH